MPTFCRHNRFIERCPICRRTLPDADAGATSTNGAIRSSSGDSSGTGATARRSRGASSVGASLAGGHRRLRASGREVRVRRETRSEDDGYSCELVPGLRSSADAARLAEEIAFASGRLSRLHAAPPDLYGEIRALAGEGEDGLERATWMCFLTAYLSPLQGNDPFAGVRLVLERERVLVDGPAAGGEDEAGVEGGAGVEGATGVEGGAGVEGATVGEGGAGVENRRAGVERDWHSPLDGVPLGPRTSHDPARGSETLGAYRRWAIGAGGQVRAFTGEESWTPERRFERAYEHLALPGFARMGRYELLVVLGRLGLYELRAGSLHLATGRGIAAENLTTIAAKRVLAVGEPVYLERRAVAFAQELSVPVDVLDLALANWGAGERATMGFKPEVLDRHTLEHVREVLGMEPEPEPGQELEPGPEESARQTG